MGRLQLIVAHQAGAAEDISNLVQEVTWSGRLGAAPRSLNATLTDDGGYGHYLASIDPTKGDWCMFRWDGEELFRGIIMASTQAANKSLRFTAYDRAVHIANSRDTFVYKNITASSVFMDVCKRFGVTVYPTMVADTKHKIPELTEPQTTGWDAICAALEATYKATGVRYYPRCVRDEMRLLERRENVLQWVLETGVNISDYSKSTDIEDIKTRIKIVSDDGKVIAEERNEALESQIGIFQDVESPGSGESEGKIRELAKSLLTEKSKPNNTLSLTCLGIPDVQSGIGVYVIVKELGISRTYYVEEDTHTFAADNHTMSISLDAATDINEVQDDGAAAAGGVDNVSVGQTVEFVGGKHYISSTSGSPVGGDRRAGRAKCTAVARGAKHPYHLVGGVYSGVGGNSNVYGWVDKEAIK